MGIYGSLFKRLPADEFVIFEPQDCRVAEWFDGLPNVFARPTPVPSQGRLQKIASAMRYWPNVFKKESFDIFEGFHLPLVKPPHGKTLLTVHDIRGIKSENRLLDRTLFKAVLSRSLKTADHVITVSEAMKEEILSYFPGTSIKAIYNGLDTTGFENVAEAELTAFRKKYSLPASYVLAVGHFEKRKNYLHLIDALALLRDRGRACPLLIVGNDSGERQAVEARIASKNLTDNVQVLSGLTDLEIRCAYKLCEMFVFPSSYEGFGIPILEAMAAERPMVLSNLPVFREITENQGIFFPHDDIEAMADAIERGLSSDNLRADLIAYGCERVKSFSFKSLAAQLDQLYRSLM